MVQQQTATTKRSKKNNKMLLEKWQENEKHLWEKGYKSTKLNKWNYQWYALKKEKPYNHPPLPTKKKKSRFHATPNIFSEPHYRPFDLTNNGESSSTNTDIWGTSNYIMQGEP